MSLIIDYQFVDYYQWLVMPLTNAYEFSFGKLLMGISLMLSDDYFLDDFILMIIHEDLLGESWISSSLLIYVKH